MSLVFALWSAFRVRVFKFALLIAAAVFLVATAIMYGAESNLLCIFLAYLPVGLLALPFAFTFILGFVFACWRTTVLSLLIAPALVIWLGHYRLPVKTAVSEPFSLNTLRVLTYNRGQGSDGVVANFAAENLPDIAAFQDAGSRLARLIAIPEFVGHSFHFQYGEFILLSRWPILENEPLFMVVPGSSSGSRLVGIRSVVEWQRNQVIIYNLHLPTPRDLLLWYAKRGTFMYGIVGLCPHTTWYERHNEYLLPWSARAAWINQLSARIRQECDPVLMMGDLNFPPVGKGYARLTEVLLDSHNIAGNGFGSTFPGNSKGWSKPLGPWMRIDHVMVSRQWQVLSCTVAEEVVSQHLPVTCVLKLARKDK